MLGAIWIKKVEVLTKSQCNGYFNLAPSCTIEPVAHTYVCNTKISLWKIRSTNWWRTLQSALLSCTSLLFWSQLFIQIILKALWKDSTIVPNSICSRIWIFKPPRFHEKKIFQIEERQLWNISWNRWVVKIWNDATLVSLWIR